MTKPDQDMENALAVKAPSKSVVLRDGLDSYLAHINKIPMLTREEEQKLALQWYDEGDKEAAQKLVLAHLRYVVKIARGYTKYGFKLPELIQEGNLGLLHAVDKFDPTKGNRLVTYAVWWIRAYIQSFVLRSWSVVRTGTTRVQRKLFSSLYKARRKLAASGEEPTHEQLAAELDLNESDFTQALDRIEARDVSLDQPIGDETGSSLSDTMADSAQNAEQITIRKDILMRIHDKMDDIYHALNPRERYILDHRLLSDEPLTLEEVGNQYGITRERVRQLESKLKEKLRKQLAPSMDESSLSD